MENQNINKEDVKNRIQELKPILSTLEWDLKRNQLNEGKKSYYTNLKNEYENLLKQLDEN